MAQPNGDGQDDPAGAANAHHDRSTLDKCWVYKQELMSQSLQHKLPSMDCGTKGLEFPMEKHPGEVLHTQEVSELLVGSAVLCVL